VRGDRRAVTDGAPARDADLIPAFVNPAAGSAAAARESIEADARFALRLASPRELPDALRAEVERGTPRVLVAGGDGTLTLAARSLAGTATAMAVLPGGTLNHFARDLGLPSDDPVACLEAAVRGRARPADAGTVNGLLFLGTSSVGAYVSYVRTRERLEGLGLGYRLASALATAWTWLRLNPFTVAVREGERAEDDERLHASPLVFVAVGERDHSPAARGARIPGGATALQLIVLRTQSRAAAATLALRVAARGLDAVAADPAIEVSLVPACEVRLRRPWGRVATDGELQPMEAPLHYRIAPGALLAVAPPADLAARPFAAGPEDAVTPDPPDRPTPDAPVRAPAPTS
jgi:diacylglycerol kinase family enzyme